MSQNNYKALVEGLLMLKKKNFEVSFFKALNPNSSFVNFIDKQNMNLGELINYLIYEKGIVRIEITTKEEN